MKTCIFSSCERLPIYPVTIEYNHKQEKVIRQNGASFHQLFIVSGGCGYLFFGEENFALEKGDMFFIRKNIGHMYEGNEDFTTSYLGFDGVLCENLFSYYDINDYGIYKSKNSENPVSMIYEFFNNFEKTEGFDIMSAHTYSIVMSFFNRALKPDFTPIEAVKNYIESNFAKPIALSDILELYPYSKAKLCRDFPAKYGMTIFQMLTKIRLIHARTMLANNPGLKLKNVAEDCGFSDISYFCKMFKREYGESPKKIIK